MQQQFFPRIPVGNTGIMFLPGLSARQKTLYPLFMVTGMGFDEKMKNSPPAL